MGLKGRELLESEGMFTLKKTPGPGMCPVALCRNKSRTGRSACMGLCNRHYQQRWRWKNPKMSAYRALKDHAEARGIPFELSPDYFAGLTDAFCYYDHSAESRGLALTVDRVRGHLGYRPGNCTIITHSENAAKGNREKWLPAHVQAILARKRAKAQEEAWKLHGEPDLEKDPF